MRFIVSILSLLFNVYLVLYPRGGGGVGKAYKLTQLNPLMSDNINFKYVQNDDTFDTFDTFSILSLNIRSLSGKFNELKSFLTSSFGTFKPNIICPQKIWNVGPYDNFDIDGYHPLNFKIRNVDGLNSNAGGGVGVYVDRQLTCVPLTEL